MWSRLTAREVSYGFGELDELVLAYATTIHKSQGSEYPAVVIPLVTQHYMMLARNLLYTGVTRGKRLVVLVGQRKALAIAVRNHGSRRRWAKLREHLAGSQSSHPMMSREGHIEARWRTGIQRSCRCDLACEMMPSITCAPSRGRRRHCRFATPEGIFRFIMRARQRN